MPYRKILHIDDDNDDCDLFSEAFKEIPNASYISINNPVEALHKLRAKLLVPDVILLDLNMPTMNGLEVLKNLKDSDILRVIPVIIFSTSSQCDLIKKTLDLGAADYFIKPNSYNGFREIIRKLV